MFYTRNFQALYEHKRKSIEDALNLIHSGDVIIVAQAGAEPRPLLEKLHIVADRVHGVDVQTCLPVGCYEFITNSSLKDSIFNHGWYFTKDLREAQTKGNATFTPQHAHIAVWKKLAGIQGRRIVLFAPDLPWIGTDTYRCPSATSTSGN